MALFLQAYLGHLLGDFVFQPGRLVVAKRKGLPGMVVHTTIVTACTALVMLGDLPQSWWAVLAAGAAHFGIEHLTVRARQTLDGSGLRIFLLDQGLHVVSLVFIAFVFSKGVESGVFVWHVPLGTLAGVCGLFTVAFLGSILAFEVRMATLGKDAPGDPILGLDGERIYGMAERGGALALALVFPTPSAGILVFIPRVLAALVAPPRRRTRYAVDAAVGLAVCTLVWLLVATLIHLST